MNRIYITIILAAALMTGCGGNGKPATDSHEGHDHAQTEQGDEGHDHEEADAHAGHDHGPAEKTNKEADPHAGHNHETIETCPSGHDHTQKTATATVTEDAGDEIIFTKAQADKTDFELYEVKPTVFNEIIAVGGEILPAQGDEASVVASVSGIVSFSAKKMVEGASVSKGEQLMYISSKNIAEGDYNAIQSASFEKARTAFERAERLIADKIISQAEYDQAKLEYDQAKTSYNAISGRASAKGISILSPIGGFVKNVLVKEGDYVSVGQQLATIAQNRRLVLRADVPQKYLSNLGAVESANFKTTYDNKVYSLKELGGRLLSVGRNSAGRSAYLPVTFEFDNVGSIVPGSFADVYIVGTPKSNTLTVPLSAVIEEQGIYSVFVQLDEEGYSKREVKLGANDGRNVEILSGLQSGNKVVSKGAYHVKMASFSGAIPHGHAH